MITPAIEPFRGNREDVELINTISEEKRSRIMRAVKSKNTVPEMIVRKLVFSMGYRYRLHQKELPGSPDLVFTRYKKAIFVHGCFWHGHQCRGGLPPKSRTDYWLPKLEANRNRDREARKKLRMMGWRTLTIWQCQLRETARVKQRIRKFLER